MITPDLVIFDCDGTLVDSEDLHSNAFLSVLHEDGFTHFDIDYAHKNWVGNAAHDILARIEEETGRLVNPNVVDRYAARVQEMMIEDVRPIAGSAHFVGLCAARTKVCVASNGERGNVLTSLTQTGLLPFFHEDHVFTKAQVVRPKPAPDLFLFAAQTMRAAPEGCLVIEDSLAGVRAGVAAGMTVWGFVGSAPDPVAQAEALQNAGAHNVFTRLEQMADIF